ncbi:MAG: cysteine-rich small domain-containing protein [Clostridia bacterium]|nr:cysteine-rich small domain-containing protein [Clostridia bacterium]MBQ2949133.1 cysteine-rich small domain-containing protein [Clostridia bacterium]MBQ4608411.1 cysteine-rich small domain-containing protein [Clostridia bacterium]MBQ6859041.1 cysteine-rich small domain-containing protein [Clostridia bacterium]MBQ7051366.1 cysteine-rich small domain-containing protein [Clostridia bacterium]
MEKRYTFFSHKACEFFPCHSGVPEEDFNCLFCYCPLYALGDRCGGRCTFLPGGVKDCSACILPHVRQNYDVILSRLCREADTPPPGPLEKEDQ